jgi:hypothetical protein
LALLYPAARCHADTEETHVEQEYYADGHVKLALSHTYLE